MWKTMWKLYIRREKRMDKSVENYPMLSTVSTFKCGKVLVHSF